MCVAFKGTKLSSAVSFYFLFTAAMAVENQTAEEITIKENASKSITKIRTDLLGHSGGHQVTLRGAFNNGYSNWTLWTMCTESCTTQRYKYCLWPRICGHDVITNNAFCFQEGTYCHQKLAHYHVRKGRDEFHNIIYISNHDPGWTTNEYVSPQNQYNSIIDKCGVVKKHNTWRMLKIIGGRPAYPGSWPWQVAVLNTFKEAFCGGTLVAPRWVLTAAHCVRKRLYIRLGEHDLAEKEGTELEMRVEMAVIHPEYDPDTQDNDVALLRLPMKVRSNRYQSIACLPKSRQTLPFHQMCYIIGWGRIRSFNIFDTDVLQEAQVPIVTQEECRCAYKNYYVTENMFCAGYIQGRVDTCAGDSGGPLLCEDSSGKWTVFGITSFGDGCGKKGKFGIYTRLPNYVRWLKRIMQSYS